MGITIDNPNTIRALGELASLTGENEAAALDAAINERIARLKGRSERLARIEAIVKEVAPRLQGLPDHGDLLYDKTTGLPI